VVHLTQDGDLPHQLGGLPEGGRDDEAALGVGFHFRAVVGGHLQELALGRGGGGQAREPLLDGFPHRHRIEPGGPSIEGGEVVAGDLLSHAQGVGFEVSLERGGELEPSLLIHGGR
jgi:hypothetical protein